jgi:ATP-dependent DNA helicase RecQ
VAVVDLSAAFRELFEFPSFRAGQREACEAALAGRDALVVMPTGSGKSLCYQLPALLRDDLTIVVSPLVSLMQDQVEALNRRALGAAALVNAQQDPAANRDAVAAAVRGDVHLLYVAPERFSSPGFFEQIARARVGLFVVDEAHCVSQWGHDFRPDYFRLADAARTLGARSVFAATATATPPVAGDIVRRLGLRDPVRVTTGFERPNLSYAVVACAGRIDKYRRLAAALLEPGSLPAIVYAGTRAATAALAVELEAELRARAAPYHAGLDRGSRAAVQQDFMSGRLAVVVATSAFGMGIDKADVRTVCHASVPGSVEAYYQEAGRAGRDGAPARCLLFAERADKGLHAFFIERSEVDDALFPRLVAALELHPSAGGYDLAVDDAAALTGCEPDQVPALIGHLARAGVVEPAPAATNRVRGRIRAPLDGPALAGCRTSAADAQRARWREYRAIWAFAEGDRCRRAAILSHFGDPGTPAPSVACCDVCEPGLVPAPGRRPEGRCDGPDSLDDAIIEVVARARPAVGRTRAVEILRGGRSKVIRQHSYDGLPPYGAFAHLAGNEVLDRVDRLLDEGRLRSTGGRFPKLVPA